MRPPPSCISVASMRLNQSSKRRRHTHTYYTYYRVAKLLQRLFCAQQAVPSSLTVAHSHPHSPSFYRLHYPVRTYLVNPSLGAKQPRGRMPMYQNPLVHSKPRLPINSPLPEKSHSTLPHIHPSTTPMPPFLRRFLEST